MNKPRASAGALLVELLVSITLLAFGITTCIRAMAQGLEIARRSQEYYMAELAMDRLFFRMVSGADDALLYEGGSGALELDGIDLADLRYDVESYQIDPYVPLTDEERAAMEAAGEEPPAPDPLAQVEERYRVIEARITWRGGKERLDFYTVQRVPKLGTVE